MNDIGFIVSSSFNETILEMISFRLSFRFVNERNRPPERNIKDDIGCIVSLNFNETILEMVSFRLSFRFGSLMNEIDPLNEISHNPAGRYYDNCKSQV